MHYFHHYVPQELTRNWSFGVFLVFYFDSREICCFHQPRLYLLMQKASSACRYWAVTLVWFFTTCLVGHNPSSVLNNRIKNYWFVATPQKLAMGIWNSAVGLYWLVLIYFQSPGFKRMCRSTHPSWSWGQALCIRPAGIPLPSAPFITISRDTSLPVELLDT